MTKVPPRHASVKAAAAACGVSRDTIRRRIASGQLTGYRLGRKIMKVDLDEVEELFRVMPTTNGSDNAAAGR